MMTIFFKLSYVKMHLPYRKSNIQRKWSDCGQISYLNSMKLSSLQNILYSEDPSPPTTLPAIPPGQPPHPAPDPALPAASSTGTTASRALRRASSLLVLLQRRGASQCATPSNILHTPSKILHTPSKILHTPSKNLRTLSKILRTLSKNLRTPSKILHNPLQYST